MKIAVFEVTEWEHEACLRLQPAHTVECRRDALTAASSASHADAEIISTFIRSDLSEPVLRRFKHLRLIATRSTGVDHIDLDYCRRAGVTVCNVPDYGDHTVAEHAFALLLALSRRIVQASDRTRRGDFSQDGLRGFDLAGKTLGVIGAGRIGRRVARIAKGFEMEVVAFDLRPDASSAAALGYRYATLEEVLRLADVVSLHVPGAPETRHLIGEAELAQMKPGAVLINTARGAVVEVEALYRALASGRLAGAGLDVVAEEGALLEEAEIFRTEMAVPVERLRALLADHALLKLPNVIITPHIAYDTAEAVSRIVETTLGNIEAFVAGAPRNRVAYAPVRP
jgi:D-lactate dehydrogenase